MGLAEHLVERVPHRLLADSPWVWSADSGSLLAELADPTATLTRRLAAGRALALRGDPRLNPTDPQMVPVVGATVEVGLDEADLAAIVARWRSVGVREDWIRKECPTHSCQLDGFRIARYPVTNEEYRHFLLDTQFPKLPTSWRFGVYDEFRANEPVWTVSPEAADAYAQWLASSAGRAFRLPTEAEWEYAASGPDHLEFPWGDQWAADMANTVEDGPLQPTPVGCYPAGRSPFGADDMAGNVEEWTSQNYVPYPGGTAVEDDLAGNGAYRVARGGSFTRYGDLARTRRRHGLYDRPIYAVGFRVAESLSGSIAHGEQQL